MVRTCWLPGWVAVFSAGCYFAAAMLIPSAAAQNATTGALPVLTLEQAMAAALKNSRNVKIASLAWMPPDSNSWLQSRSGFLR